LQQINPIFLEITHFAKLFDGCFLDANGCVLIEGDVCQLELVLQDGFAHAEYVVEVFDETALGRDLGDVQVD